MRDLIMSAGALLVGATLAACQPPCGRLDPPVDASAGPGGGGNLLVVVLDDVGVEQLSAYGLGERTAHTPTIDCLCERGLRFTQVWASPSCSPARGELLTGRYNHRLGLGTILSQRVDYQLPLEEDTLPEVLGRAGYATGLFGKWHLTAASSDGALRHPNDSGFDRFAGSIGNIYVTVGEADVDNYDRWQRIADGKAEVVTRYPTVQLVDDALDFVDEVGDQPWLVVLSFQAPHVPVAWPPSRLYRDTRPAHNLEHQQYLAMLEAVDHELSRFLRRLPRDMRADTTVVLTSDNGSNTTMIDPSWPIRFGKGSVYELGVRVPFVVSGPSVGRPGETTDALAHLVDVLPTLAEIVGVEAPGAPDRPVDGVSLLPVVQGQEEAVRQTVFAGKFRPLGGPPEIWTRAVRDATHKLVVEPDGREELFAVGPGTIVEGDDLLLGGASAADLERLEALREALALVAPDP